MSCDEIVAFFCAKCIATNVGDSPPVVEYVKSFRGLVALHVLVRQSQRDAILLPAPALFVMRFFGGSFESSARDDFDWMLTMADRRLAKAFVQLQAIDDEVARQSRSTLLCEFENFYEQLRNHIGQNIGVLVKPDDAMFDQEAYLVARADSA